MNLFSDINPLYFIILPIVFAQYILATFALVRLARAQFATGKYVLWNIFIIFGVFIGPTVFFIYDAVAKKRRADGAGSGAAAGSAAHGADACEDGKAGDGEAERSDEKESEAEKEA